jgi:hypothetical protein
MSDRDRGDRWPVTWFLDTELRDEMKWLKIQTEISLQDLAPILLRRGLGYPPEDRRMELRMKIVDEVLKERMQIRVRPEAGSLPVVKGAPGLDVDPSDVA